MSYENDPKSNQPVINLIPEICPVCGRGTALEPQFFNQGPNGLLYVFRCSHRDCRCIFAYFLNRNSNKVTSVPINDRFEGITQEALNISPAFKEIYFQSSSADQLNYSELDGMGYRRALEYLVKDYLLSFQLTDKSKEDVYHMSLSDAIKLLDNDELKNLAKASSWLGNDYSHTEIKWDDYGMEDLKSFIKAFASFIQFKVNAQKAQEIIDSRD